MKRVPELNYFIWAKLFETKLFKVSSMTKYLNLWERMNRNNNQFRAVYWQHWTTWMMRIRPTPRRNCPLKIKIKKILQQQNKLSSPITNHHSSQTKALLSHKTKTQWRRPLKRMGLMIRSDPPPPSPFYRDGNGWCCRGEWPRFWHRPHWRGARIIPRFR